MTNSLAEKQRKTILLTVIGLTAIVAISFTAIIIKFVNEKPDLKQILEAKNVLWFNEPRALPDVSLTRHTGEPFGSKDLKGQWNLLNFGYTYCPDICPTNMADMKIAEKKLAEKGLQGNVKYWMITVDPERDTVEKLSQYVPYFHPDFIGLTGDVAQITQLATQVSTVFYKEGEGEFYTVAHSDNLAVVDPNGHFVALLRPPHRPQEIADSLSLMIEYGKR